MTIHKQGYATLLIVFFTLFIFNGIIFYFVDYTLVHIFFLLDSLFFFFFILQFFRNPNRTPKFNEKAVLSPADGTIVVIEETEENEYFKGKRLQVSIFMSALNVHINWFPITGIVKYYRYHAGLFLLARNPKSSTDNERNTIVIQNENGTEILFRQIAGIMARRIISPITEGQDAKQGQEFGFIKFGSRVDIFFPLGTKLNVKLGDKVTGTQTEIAELSN